MLSERVSPGGDCAPQETLGDIWDNAVITTGGQRGAEDPSAVKATAVPRAALHREQPSPRADRDEGDTLAEPDSIPAVMSWLAVPGSLEPHKALQSLSSPVILAMTGLGAHYTHFTEGKAKPGDVK